MHTQGTAVLDRPAEATAPANTSLSLLFSDPNDPRSAKSISNAEALATRLVDGWGATELAVALYASGARPQRLRSADAAQLMQWATQGLARLGIDRVRHYATRTQRINLHAAYDDDSPADQAEYAHMWPCSYRTVQSCHDAAWRLIAAADVLSKLPGSAL